jgi:hypothetical protein
MFIRHSWAECVDERLLQRLTSIASPKHPFHRVVVAPLATASPPAAYGKMKGSRLFPFIA